MLLILFFFFFFSIAFSSSSSSSSPTYLKLPLLPSLPFPTLQQALAIDSIRLSSLSSLSAPIVSAASSGAGQYLVSLRLGSPPQPLRLVVDTGSDLLWIRCSPCRSHCRARRRRRRPSFFPRHSSSFSPFHCYHPSCALLPPLSPSSTCPRSPLHTPCRYKYSYADRSSTAGLFSRELSAGVGPLSFGCAFNVSAGPEFSSAHGVLGLGRGPISFSSQLARKTYGSTFSYCLMDYTLSPPPTSYLLFGADAINSSLSTAGTVLRSTPLQPNPLSPTFYYVRVLGVSVGGARLRIPSSVWALDPATGNGGTIVDSGTTLSFLPQAAYDAVVGSMRRRLGKAAAAFAPGAAPPGFDLCIDSSAAAAAVLIPKLSFRLGGGAELSPPPRNYFIEAAEGVRCLALQPVGAAGFGVIGNLMQQGFVLVFDRAGSRLGFAYTGCA